LQQASLKASQTIPLENRDRSISQMRHQLLLAFFGTESVLCDGIDVSGTNTSVGSEYRQL